MNILIIVASMYLAGVLLNTIQICRLYQHFEGGLPIPIIFYTIVLILFHPLYVVVGLRNSLLDWDWMFSRFYKDENDNFQVRKGENSNG